jgi:hypothetical protein
MKCPVCKAEVKDFFKHALNHVRDDEAYAVETWDHQTASANLALHPLPAPLGPGDVKPLQKKFNTATTRLLIGSHLRMLERRRKARGRPAS